MTNEEGVVDAPEEKPKRATTPKTPALPKDIGSIIPLIRAELGVIEKDQKASGGGANYAFRGHDQIVNAIVPLFNKYGIYTTVEDESLAYQGRNAGTKYATASLIREAVTFWAPDGSSRTTTIVAESVDYGNKATGQASTYAYRLALTKTFTIPTGDPDPDATSEVFEATSEAPPVAQPSAPGASSDVKELRGQVAARYAVLGVTEKDDILARGTKFFNGRSGWDDNAAALNKLIKALDDGDPKVLGE